MSELLKPPAVPSAILNFFASQPDFPAVAGDISEEFHQRIQSSGPRAAKRWYWREALRNAFALTWRELRRTPVRTTLLALGCLLAVNLIVDVYAILRYYPLPVIEIFNAPRHRSANYLVNFIASVAVGWTGGRLLRGREWALALTFTFITAITALPGAWYLLQMLKRNPLPASMWEFMIVGTILRQGAFWLGCLLVRYVNNRKHSSIVSAAKSA
jgi:hypothetical protein